VKCEKVCIEKICLSENSRLPLENTTFDCNTMRTATVESIKRRQRLKIVHCDMKRLQKKLQIYSRLQNLSIFCILVEI
jgi:hypothetical protein